MFEDLNFLADFSNFWFFGAKVDYSHFWIFAIVMMFLLGYLTVFLFAFFHKQETELKSLNEISIYDRVLITSILGILSYFLVLLVIMDINLLVNLFHSLNDRILMQTNTVYIFLLAGFTILSILSAQKGKKIFIRLKQTIKDFMGWYLLIAALFYWLLELSILVDKPVVNIIHAEVNSSVFGNLVVVIIIPLIFIFFFHLIKKFVGNYVSFIRTVCTNLKKSAGKIRNDSEIVKYLRNSIKKTKK
jgi:hypothetical protein